MTRDQINAVLTTVPTWPLEDQEELAELAREIEARRSGIYKLTDDERRHIADARQTPLASEDEVAAFWKARGIS